MNQNLSTTTTFVNFYDFFLENDIFVKQLNTIKCNSILKFIIHLCAIYINPVITII